MLLEILTAAVPLGAAATGAAAYGTFCPSCGYWGHVALRASAKHPTVALTFDDGPTPGGTESILKVLSEMRVRATFFVIGQHAQRHPELIRRIDAEGHLLANHSFEHSHLGFFRGPIYWKRELSKTDEVLAQIIGRRPALFRPPMGITTPIIHRAARRSGHTLVNWTRRAKDGVRTSTAEILARLRDPAAAGEILVLHDGVDPNLKDAARIDRAATIDAIRPLVTGLRDRGLSAVRLDELLEIAPYND